MSSHSTTLYLPPEGHNKTGGPLFLVYSLQSNTKTSRKNKILVYKGPYLETLVGVIGLLSSRCSKVSSLSLEETLLPTTVRDTEHRNGSESQVRCVSMCYGRRTVCDTSAVVVE